MIELLVDRLRWPAALVRERAASQLGDRIAAGDDGAVHALLVWIADQELESLAAIGLLPFLHAAGRAGANPLSTSSIASAVRARSVLSELYLGHLDPSYESNPSLGRHSGLPPSAWEPPRRSAGTREAFFEEMIRERLQRAPRVFQAPLERQFDFELSILGGRHGESPASAYSAAGPYESGYHPGWRPISAEIRTSAYLRALAWAASHTSAPDDWVLGAAARVSPVDLGLWSVRPTKAPGWWPSLDPNGDASEIDAEVATTLRKVNAAVQAWQSDGHAVLAASGCISQTKPHAA